jgi:hypothetical protein
MKLKKLAAALAVGLASIAANATPIDGLFLSRTANPYLVTDLSGEFSLNPDGTPKDPTVPLAVNDLLVGGLGFESFSNPLSPIVSTGRELTAVFASKITGVETVVGSGNFSNFIVDAPGAAFWATQGIDLTALGVDMSKVAILVFEDAAAGGFDRGDGIAAAMAEAGDGVLRAVLGFDGVDDFWYARGPSTIGGFASATGTDPLGRFNFGLSFLYENLAVDFQDMTGGLSQDLLDLNYPVAGGGGSILTPTDGTIAQAFGDGALFKPTAANAGVTDPFPIYNKVDVTLSSVPEPGTLALVGLSLVGLAGLRRKLK